MSTQTQNLFLYYDVLIIVLFSLQTTVNLLLPHLVYTSRVGGQITRKAKLGKGGCKSDRKSNPGTGG